MRKFKFELLIDDLDSLYKGHIHSFNITAENEETAWKLAEEYAEEHIKDLVGRLEEYTLLIK